MNINKVESHRDTNIYEINQSVSEEDLAQLCQTLKSRSEEDQALKDALQDLIKALETRKLGTAKTAASGLLENIGASTLANVLGGSALVAIQRLMGM